MLFSYLFFFHPSAPKLKKFFLLDKNDKNENSEKKQNTNHTKEDGEKEEQANPIELCMCCFVLFPLLASPLLVPPFLAALFSPPLFCLAHFVHVCFRLIFIYSCKDGKYKQLENKTTGKENSKYLPLLFLKQLQLPDLHSCQLLLLIVLLATWRCATTVTV